MSKLQCKKIDWSYWLDLLKVPLEEVIVKINAIKTKEQIFKNMVATF